MRNQGTEGQVSMDLENFRLRQGRNARAAADQAADAAAEAAFAARMAALDARVTEGGGTA